MKFETEDQRREARIRVAHDVLTQLAARRIQPFQGTWVDQIPLTKKDFEQNVDLQEVFKRTTPEKPCSVCALGALFVAAVEAYDELPLQSEGLFHHGTPERVKENMERSAEYWESEVSRGTASEGDIDEYVSKMLRNSFFPMEGLYGYLGKFFPKEMLILMEIAFEKGHGATDLFGDQGPVDLTPTELLYAGAVRFGEQHTLPDERLAAIMQNLIDNKGDFVIEPASEESAKDLFFDSLENRYYEEEEDEEDDEDEDDED